VQTDTITGYSAWGVASTTTVFQDSNVASESSSTVFQDSKNISELSLAARSGNERRRTIWST
jgi:hypothetical protein